VTQYDVASQNGDRVVTTQSCDVTSPYVYRISSNAY